MSYVTSVVVHVDYPPEEVEKALLEPFPFDERYEGGVGFGKMEDLDWPGGTKVFQGDLYAGGFNYLNLDALIEWFVGLPWDSYSNAVLSLSTEGDYHQVVLIRNGK